jgi:hypothetical protein
MPGRDRFDGDFDAVLTAARAGEARGIERIFVALSPVVEGYLRLQGAAEPQDLTSEVFLAVVRNIGSFAGDEASFRSWVFTIAHRRLLDERRRATLSTRWRPSGSVRCAIASGPTSATSCCYGCSAGSPSRRSPTCSTSRRARSRPCSGAASGPSPG